MIRTAISHLQAVASWALTVMTLSALAILARLDAAPVSLDPLAPILEREIAERLGAAAPGWRVEIAGAEIAWDGREHGFGLRLKQLKVLEPSGGVAFQAPGLSVGLNAADAVRGVATPTGLSVIGAEVVVARDTDGGWRFAVAGPDAPDAATDADQEAARSAQDRLQATAALIDAWSDASGEAAALPMFRRVSMLRGGVTYLDEVSGAVWRARDAQLEAARPEGGGLTLSIAASLALDEKGAPTELAITGRREPGSTTATVDLRFVHAPAATIAAQFPDLDAFRALEGFVSGRASASISLESGDLLSFSARLLGEGAEFAALRRGAALSVSNAAAAADAVDPLALSAFDAVFDYDPSADVITLRRLEVAGDRLRAEVAGRARFLRDENGAALGAAGSLSIRSATILDDALFDQPLSIESGGFAFRLEGGAPGSSEAPKLWIDDLKVKTADLSAEGSARILFQPPSMAAEAAPIGAALGARANLALALSDFQATRLPRFWPLPAAPGGRAWIVDNVEAGWLRKGRLKAKIGGGAGFVAADGSAPAAAEDVDAAAAAGGLAETIEFNFEFDGLATRYLRDMTPVTDGAGVGRVHADGFVFDLAKGRIDLDEDGVVTLDGSRFEIIDFAQEPPPAEINIKSKSSARALLALLDQEPLALPRKRDVKPQSAKGSVVAATKMTMPLASDLPIEAIVIDARGTLTDMSLPVERLDGAVVSARRARPNVTSRDLRLQGDLRVDRFAGVSFATDLRETFSPKPGDPSTRLSARATLSAERLLAFGFPSDWAPEGALRLRLSIEDGADRPTTLRAGGDFEPLGLSLPWIDWWKTPGEPGRIEVMGRIKDGVWKLQNLVLTSKGLMARGWAELDEDGALSRLQLAPLRLETGTEMTVSLALPSDGSMDFSATGPTLNLSGGRREPRPASVRRAAEEAKERAEAAAKKDPGANDFKGLANVAFDRVTFGDGVGLTDATLSLNRPLEGGIRGVLSAKAKGTKIAGQIRPGEESAGGGALYYLKIDDLGATMTALGLVERAERGEATIVAREIQSGRIRGKLEGRGLVLKSAPAMAEFISAASLVGIFEQAASGGITFNKIEAPFMIDERRMVVNQLVASGPSLGMTVKGLYDRKTEELDVRGSVSPFNVINALPNQLPIIGELLTGGEGRGLLGFTFTVQGPVDRPKTKVDPLSPVMLGPLRRIFGRG